MCLCRGHTIDSFPCSFANSGWIESNGNICTMPILYFSTYACIEMGMPASHIIQVVVPIQALSDLYTLSIE